MATKSKITFSAYAAEKSTIAKLPLDAATRMPGRFHRNFSGGLKSDSIEPMSRLW